MLLVNLYHLVFEYGWSRWRTDNIVVLSFPNKLNVISIRSIMAASGADIEEFLGGPLMSWVSLIPHLC